VSHFGSMVSELERLGDIGRWRAPLRQVPRHLFVPDRAWCTPDDGAGFVIDRGSDPARWMEAAYADMSIVTQLDDGATDVVKGKGEYTSSLSAPSVTLAGLSLLNPDRDDRILEIGTGTGWTAGLLSHVVGDENVTSIEIDQEVLTQAAGNLEEARYSPRLVLGDGAKGWLKGAPYDRVHVTCGVREVPYAWVEQTRPGGVIVLPWMSSPDSGQLTCLTVHDDGTAVGRFYGEVNFMMLRTQRFHAQDAPESPGTGITVTSEGEQVWLGNPSNVIGKERDAST
jgi:protein-L-isoaspartate O-methyltransferase